MASNLQDLKIVDVKEKNPWMIDPKWAQKEGLRGYVGMPVREKGQLLGLLTLFTRFPLTPGGVILLRQFFGHAAAIRSGTFNLSVIDKQLRQLELENIHLREAIDEVRYFGEIIGKGPAHQRLIRQIELVSKTDATVMISGESGTGKELVAKEIHKRSLRKNGPLITINCASIPRNLFESEFFGHAKGAFTGAVKDRAGRYEAADGGTLFLDEVGEIPLSLQPKLLRLLQEGTYERVGEGITRQADVRIIAATNRDLKKEVERKRFRNDLYYRLNVFPIDVAPLRKRKEDLDILAAHFLKVFARKLQCSLPKLRQADISRLKEYGWPGNVRELQNIIERAVIVSRAEQFGLHLPDVPAPKQFAAPVGEQIHDRAEMVEIFTDSQMKQKERENILTALDHCDWKIYGPGGTAELLEMKPTTLASRIQKLGLVKPNRQ
jgi:transcriptional regulator with GAF, ATPase, and Fis domain